MIYGHISAADSYAHLLVNSSWKLSFDWLRTVTSSTPTGIQKLQGDEIYVNVHGYDTLPREECRFESHRRYVDLQYCISGGEIIDWSLASALEPDAAFDSDKDLQFYCQPQPGPSLAGQRSASDVLISSSCLLNSRLSPLSMFPGSFAIFHPSDAHRPKVRDGVNPSVFKLVIKVDRRLAG
jgi:YhcH/YjgK/YiaL family protein